ncbi:DUF2841 domain-containing protein [Aspergillus homomorphus CBS 101889]|uniref:Subtelomeric hrmA-associated cluster protein AFUB-079030/YDR124W-like helical bundle domain-containing protein n=1 Tax=Aspergillus homomorphus (strain CBS 101889) TaxID=1450537 RepID=A0A395HZJ8_ASPHC|nr:hypothetical protein BO97DRAFT_470498 [Aspergillus homomorphus CBS 101889]RAL12298.1 hypothetical protein BO97DRAFT_470498 [Aspergillus homomorphus CBS 101889]
MTAQSSHTGMQRSSFGLRYAHFAVLCIDHSGHLRLEGSPSIAGCEKDIFTEDVQGRFLRSVASAWQSSLPSIHSSESNHADTLGHLSGEGAGYDPWYHQTATTRPAGLIPCDLVSMRNNKNARRSLRKTNPASISPLGRKPGSPTPGKVIRTTALRLGDTDSLRQYYEKAFDQFQQLNCRVIAKALIKLVEPRKQVNYPYNGRRTSGSGSQKMDPELTKPGWWPDGVTHREPDHLFKRERIRLLVHILCDLRTSKGITAKSLEEAGQDVRRAIQPSTRLAVLDEIFYVRKMEELYLDGKISGETTIRVMQAHLTDEYCVPEPQEQTTDCSRVHSQARALPSDSQKLEEIAEQHRDGDRPERSFQLKCKSPSSVDGSQSEKDSSSPSACFSLSPASTSTTNREGSLESGIPKELADVSGSSKANRDPGTFRDIHSTVSQCLPEYFAQQVPHPPSGQGAPSGYWATLPYNGY